MHKVWSFKYKHSFLHNTYKNLIYKFKKIFNIYLKTQKHTVFGFFNYV